jgi:hypothetical protein
MHFLRAMQNLHFPLQTTLPVVATTLKEDAPEYLKWTAGYPRTTKSALRQLSAAFEDVIGTKVDWERIGKLKGEEGVDALTYCTQHPFIVGNNISVHILGITHSSDHSAEHVQKAIETIRPGRIALESCVDRTAGRRQVQLPLVEQFGCDWPVITDTVEFGGTGPSLKDLAKHGLLEGNLDVAQFMVASGSVSGCPELTAMHFAETCSIPLDSIDIPESIKIVQNASVDTVGYTSRRQGDLSEGVLRQVVDEEGILAEYFRMMYGDEALYAIQPSFLYRLIESRKRSPVYADLLLRELHRVYRPKQYWTRIYMRDLYMAFRLRRIAAGMPAGSSILVVAGGAHAFGIRDLVTDESLDLSSLAAISLACLLDNAQNLCDAWRDVLCLDSFGSAKNVSNPQAAAAIIAISILSTKKVLYWVDTANQWQVVNLPVPQPDMTPGSRLEQLTAVEVAGVGTVDLIAALAEGKVDPYSITRQDEQTLRE